MPSKYRAGKLPLRLVVVLAGVSFATVPAQAENSAPVVGIQSTQPAQPAAAQPGQTTKTQQQAQTRRTIPPPAQGAQGNQRRPSQPRVKKAEPAAEPEEEVVEEPAEEPAPKAAPKTNTVYTPDKKYAAQPVKRGPVRTIKKEVAPLLKTAYEQMVTQDFRGAVATIREALKEDSQCITAQRYLAYCLAEGGLPTEALEALTRLIKQIKPTYFEWCTFGEVYLRSESLDNAERCYLEAQKTTPGSDFARSGLIRVYIRTDRAEEAIKLCIEGMKAAKDKALYDYYVLLHTKAQQARRVSSPSGGGGEDDAPEPDPNASTES